MRNGTPDSSEISDCRGHPGIRNGNDDVGGHGMLASEKFAERFAAVMHAAAENQAIGAREIDMLENAVLMRLGRREANGFESRARDAQHFSGFDFANVIRIQQIERASFGCDHIGIAAGGRGRADGNREDREWRKVHRA